MALDEIEAETPEEAYTSTEIGREIFLSKDEIPYAILTAVGIGTVCVSGASLIRNKEEK